MKKKKSFKTLSLATAAFLLCLPLWLFANGGNAHAEEVKQGVSGNDVQTAVCTCRAKCGAYEYDHDCAVCAADYKACRYQKPNVAIYINKPDGWYNDTATVTFKVSDTAKTGNFELVKLQAKIGQNGSWMDITEDKKLEITENCTIYAQATDQNGNAYEKSRTVRCFDNTKPTLNAAVSDGLLSIQVHDTESGAKTVYVNGYEFKDLTNGALHVRLQQFDTGYEYFTVTAMDHAGNTSEVYKVKNPYYKIQTDESDGDSKGNLPQNAEASKPGSAAAEVTEHARTDSEGNAISLPDETEQEEYGKLNQGKEFYTIQTASEKVFYLIIDRDGEEETVYFLTEITENDLLNVTSDNSETLPQNSAALESAIPVTEDALPNNNTDAAEDKKNAETEKEADEEEAPAPEQEEPAEEPAQKPDTAASYIILGVLAIAAVIIGYYFKVVRRKKEDFLDEDEEEEEEYEELSEEEEDPGEEEYDEFFEELEE